MGTHSSDLISVARQHQHSTYTRPVRFETRQCADAERDLSDGGGKGFMLFLFVMALAALVWWLV